MARLCFKGVTTHLLYQFESWAMPAALVDDSGNPVPFATYNGEELVQTTEMGEVLLAVKTSPGPDDPYGFGQGGSPWEAA